MEIAGRPSQDAEEPIILADGTEATMRAVADLTVQVEPELTIDQFRVVPTSRSTMLIGTDLWAKFEDYRTSPIA